MLALRPPAVLSALLVDQPLAVRPPDAMPCVCAPPVPRGLLFPTAACALLCCSVSLLSFLLLPCATPLGYSPFSVFMIGLGGMREALTIL